MPQFSADEVQVASAMAGVRENQSPADAQTPPAATQEPEVLRPTLDYREFDPRHKEPFTGMLYVGRLDDEFTLFGHKFTIVTPTQTERLQVGPVIKEFRDTITNEIAYQAAIVALYLVSVDDHPLPEPIMLNVRDGALRDRFNWVTANITRPVINAVCDRCMILEEEVDLTLEAMGKASA